MDAQTKIKYTHVQYSNTYQKIKPTTLIPNRLIPLVSPPPRQTQTYCIFIPLLRLPTTEIQKGLIPLPLPH